MTNITKNHTEVFNPFSISASFIQSDGRSIQAVRSIKISSASSVNAHLQAGHRARRCPPSFCSTYSKPVVNHSSLEPTKKKAYAWIQMVVAVAFCWATFTWAAPEDCTSVAILDLANLFLKTVRQSLTCS